MMEKGKLLYQQNASIKSIIKYSSLPLFFLLAILLVALQALMIFKYGFDLNTFIIEVVLLGIGIVAFSMIITKWIEKYTFINVYENGIEVSDVSKSSARLTFIPFEEIIEISVDKNIFKIEGKIKLTIRHLHDPYELERKIKEHLPK